MDDKPTKRGDLTVLLLVALLVLLPMLYVLSIGPVAWMIAHGVIDDSLFVRGMYYPMSVAYRTLPIIRPAFDSYIQFWETLGVSTTTTPAGS